MGRQRKAAQSEAAEQAPPPVETPAETPEPVESPTPAAEDAPTDGAAAATDGGDDVDPSAPATDDQPDAEELTAEEMAALGLADAPADDPAEGPAAEDAPTPDPVDEGPALARINGRAVPGVTAVRVGIRHMELVWPATDENRAAAQALVHQLSDVSSVEAEGKVMLAPASACQSVVGGEVIVSITNREAIA